jgi:hypothetical protein
VAWLRHAQEEALDLAVYLEAEIQNRLRGAADSPSDKDQATPRGHAATQQNHE